MRRGVDRRLFNDDDFADIAYGCANSNDGAGDV
jgi:hypothetical protein